MTEEDVRQALKGVEDPEAGMSVVDLGLVYGISFSPERMSGDARKLFGWS
jgi:metal-sulfur cluster biosynthetic enzyme